MLETLLLELEDELLDALLELELDVLDVSLLDELLMLELELLVMPKVLVKSSL